MWILMAGESVSALCHLCLMSTSRKPEADKEIDFTFSLASHHKPRQYQAKTWASEKMENIHSENKLLNVFFKDNSLNIEEAHSRQERLSCTKPNYLLVTADIVLLQSALVQIEKENKNWFPPASSPLVRLWNGHSFHASQPAASTHIDAPASLYKFKWEKSRKGFDSWHNTSKRMLKETDILTTTTQPNEARAPSATVA